jgi:hypothetical protein
MANKRQKQDQLAQSDRFIAAVKQSINKQLDLIDELKRAGRDAAEDEEFVGRSHTDIAGDAGSSAGDIGAEHSASVGANHPPKSARAKTT